MNFFKRLFKIGQSEANAAIDNMEDPIKLTEQGIRDLKENLGKSLESLAQVKALAIRSKIEIEELESASEDYKQKAILILKRGQQGDIELSEADRLAKEALIKKEETQQKMISTQKDVGKFNTSVSLLEQRVHEIKQNISKWENELKTLKARVKVSKATKNLNKQMAEIDSSGTVSMLERMKDKVQQEEALAEAYGEMARTAKTIDQELTEAVDVTQTSAEQDLQALKKQLGLNTKDQ